jgi:hypothetical protein
MKEARCNRGEICYYDTVKKSIKLPKILFYFKGFINRQMDQRERMPSSDFG